MVEMLGTLAIIGVLSVTGIWAYGNAIDSHKANRILNDLNARIHDCSAQMVMMNKDECVLSGFSDKMDNTYSTSVQKIDSDFFKVIISDIPQKICQQILNKGIPLASHISPTNCNETNQFELIFHKNLDSSIFRKKCTSDVDCDVCGSCDSDGYCLGECSLPAPDSEENCGENECIVYDEESKTCRDACERVEYLESTGSQYIDTGILANGSFDVEYKIKTDSTNTRNFIVAGARTTTQHLNFGQFEISPKNLILAYLTTWWSNTSGIALNTEYEVKVHYESGKQYAILNGETIGNNSLSGTERLDMNIYLFKRNFHTPSSETIKPMIGRMYYFKMYNDGVLVRDFIPVLDWDMNPCMYDKVSEELFRNSGTGTFKTNLDE